MRFDVLTIFPRMFAAYLDEGVFARAVKSGVVDVGIVDIREYARGAHKTTDDRPYGGGEGMVMKPGPIYRALESVERVGDRSLVVLLSPQGQRLDQRLIEQLSGHRRLILLCGRYEGFDQRIVDILQPDEVSIGDFVLNGGEVAAMVLIDCLIRLVPGVLGDEQSPVDDSFSTGNRLLESAQYTRPREYRGHAVPEVLLSGDHQAIARWRDEESLKRTQLRRADLLERGNNNLDTNDARVDEPPDADTEDN